MDETQKQIYESLIKIARENGYEILKGKELSPEERARVECQHKEISDYLKKLDEFENNPRGLTIRVGSLETSAA